MFVRIDSGFLNNLLMELKMSNQFFWMSVLSLVAFAAVCVQRIPEGQVYCCVEWTETAICRCGMHFVLP
jgi:hypothetical protein